MGVFKKIVFCLCTIIVIVTGFFMPVSASKALNRRLCNSVEEMENKKISLVLSNSEEAVKSTLTFSNLINKDSNTNISIVDISEKSKICHLTYNKVKEILLKILNSLNTLCDGCDDFEAVPQLFITIGDETIEQSTIYWKCIWKNKNNIQQVMWIDDISGKMVGLIMNDNAANGSDENNKTEADNSDTDIPKEVTSLVNYCKENYQADDINCIKTFDESRILETHYIIEITIKENGYTAIYPISVYFGKGQYLSFNIE